MKKDKTIRKHTTHFACKEIMESFGGKAWCCICVGHACLRSKKEKICDCHCHRGYLTEYCNFCETNHKPEKKVSPPNRRSRVGN
jgi:hypothetical protein